MDAAEIYQDYLALKAHFSGSYSYQKYQGKIRASLESVGFQRDKFFYMKVAKHRDPHRFLLANIATDKKAFIRSLAYSADAERIYIDYVARTESLGYFFKEDIKKLGGDLKSNLYSCNHPPIVVLYLSKEIMFETLCIIIKETNMLERWEKAYPYDPMMEEIIFKIKKYTPFIKYERVKIRRILHDEFVAA